MKAYSEDLPQKIVEATERGVSKAQAARLFGVSLSSVKRYVRLARPGGSLAPGKGFEGRPPKIDERTPRSSSKKTWKNARLPPSLKRRRFLEHISGESLSDSTVGRMLKRMGFSQKNGARGVGRERDEFLRAAWKTMVAEKLYVWVDWCILETRWAPTPRWRPCTPGRPRASGRAARSRGTPW
jgi:transposase